MNLSGLEAYHRAVRLSSRVGPDQKPDGARLKVDSKGVAHFRAHSNQLVKRLRRDSLDDAAYGGLQDSAPRSALLSLHARVRDVGPHDWEDPTLVQVWFRGADYVVPRKDVGVFTLGTLPRDPEQVSALHELANEVVKVLKGRPMAPKEAAKSIKDLPSPFAIRSACITGKVVIRWDASKIDLIPAKPPNIDPEQARLELARRFLHWLGPAGPMQFAKWGGVPRADAQETWKVIESELVHVDFDGRGRWILASDESMFRRSESFSGVRLLPMGDPYLYLGETLPAPLNRIPLPKPSASVSTRLINSLTGRILFDGKLAGAWGRVQHKVSIFPWSPISKRIADRISSEASRFERPIGRPIEIRWLG